MSKKQHWDEVYSNRTPLDVSWFQQQPTISLSLINSFHLPKDAAIIDVDKVQVMDGPFTNFTGTVDEVRADRGRVKVMISVFGRPTPVELEFTQLEKI